MNASIELQVISKILTSDDESLVQTLLEYDDSYYSLFTDQIRFIHNHVDKYKTVPDVFTFQSEFPEITLVAVNESLAYFRDAMANNKSRNILIETFNKIKDLSSGDARDAWRYIMAQAERVENLDSSMPMDIVHDAHLRSDQVLEFNRQARIPTGFAEIDKLMYGGLSTVEELVLLVARTNTGKSWVCTKMMESAQKVGFPVLYYSPEMQASFLGTRFDTWRKHFLNSDLFRGRYTEGYLEYLRSLSKEETSAYILEDKDMSEGEVNTKNLANLVRRHGIKLLIIDGLSYMSDVHRSDTDYQKYKNIVVDLFQLSKRYGCAVVVAMQANRATRENVDDKGDPFPNLYTIEGSDHPARIATQVFSMRQVFDKHVLDIRLEKSRNAANQKPVLSYSWDPNTGNMQYIPDVASSEMSNSVISPTTIPGIPENIPTDDELLASALADDVEF